MNKILTSIGLNEEAHLCRFDENFGVTYVVRLPGVPGVELCDLNLS